MSNSSKSESTFQKEIDNLKNQLEKLKESEKRYKNIIELAPDGIITVSSRGIILSANSAICKLSGYKRKELEKKHLARIKGFKSKDIQYFIEIFREIIGKPRVRTFDLQYINPKGKKIDLTIHAKVLTTKNNQKIIQAIIRNSTKEKIAKKALKASEKRYTSLFEDSPISIWEEDFSECKKYLDKLVFETGKTIETIFEEDPKQIIKCVSLVKLVDINKITLKLFKAKSKEEFKGNLDKFFTKNLLKILKLF